MDDMDMGRYGNVVATFVATTGEGRTSSPTNPSRRGAHVCRQVSFVCTDAPAADFAANIKLKKANKLQTYTIRDVVYGVAYGYKLWSRMNLRGTKRMFSERYHSARTAHYSSSCRLSIGFGRHVVW